MDHCPECGHEAGAGEPGLTFRLATKLGIKTRPRKPECPRFHVDYAEERCFCQNAYHPVEAV